MLKQIPLSLFLFGASALSSCGKHELPPQEYVAYIQNSQNGLFVSTKANGVNYTLQYQPTDYLVMLQLKSFSIPAETFKEQYNRFKGIEHYVFHIDRKEWDSLVTKASDTSKVRKGMTEYLDFKIQKDIKLVEGDDTIPCGISECESSMGMLPYYSFVLGFNAKDYSGDRKFIYGNKMIGTGNIKLEITSSSIKKIPKLKMNG
ncbi:MAG TPA: hypothetical protein VK809_02855 [Bacteroidia bacterium]|jgi:hypothetical protein|nr:hypothetical protein [Bacteroidia bacterium]